MAGGSFVLHAADVWTADPARPRASVIVVVEGQVAAIGGEELLARWGAQLPMVEAAGRTVLPGFVDVHNHHAVAGRADLFELQLPPDASYEQVLEAVRVHAAGLGPGSWVTGGSWGSTLVGLLSQVDAAADLDAAAGGRPVMLNDDSHHNRWASSAALAAAGIDRDSADPAGGRVVRHPSTGAPTGLLFETAGLPVEEAATAGGGLTPAQHEASSRRGIELLHSFGVTAFQDAGATVEMLRALKALDDRGELTAWVVTSMLINDPIFGTAVVGEQLFPEGIAARSVHHRPTFVKIFLDGVPPTRTGAFLEPYLPDDSHPAHHRGSVSMGPTELAGWLERAAAVGLSAKIHCTGDAAVRAALDAVAAVRAAGYDRPQFQIAHGQFVAEEDVPRFAELDVSADISPYLWVPGVIPEAIATVLPAARASRMQPNRALLDAGARVAVGSDWPVSESPDPLEAMQGLITRADPYGRRPGRLWPEQAVTFAEALAAVTSAPAAAMGLEDVTGSLQVGRSADLMVLDGVLEPAEPDRIVQRRVAETFFAGELVYQR